MVPHIRADYASPAPDLLYAMRVRRPFTPTNLELGSHVRLDVCHGQPHDGRGISRLTEHAKSLSFELNFMGVPKTTNDPEQTPYRELSKLIGGAIKNVSPKGYGLGATSCPLYRLRSQSTYPCPARRVDNVQHMSVVPTRHRIPATCLCPN